jgi:hypothetical protein
MRAKVLRSIHITERVSMTHRSNVISVPVFFVCVICEICGLLIR